MCPKLSTFMFDSPTFDLDGYIKFRPAYSEALYAEIYEYHKSQGGQWDFAHDAGTGAGIVAEELAKRFTTVAASDPSAFYMEQAKRRLSPDGKLDKFLFGCYPGEDMSWLPSASVDMITMAEAIHWTEHQAVLKSASKALKPGGTLAIWQYGILPYFVNSAGAQNILNRIFDRWLGRTKANTAPDKLAQLNRGMRMMRLRTNEIEFDKSAWKPGVRRIHWNLQHPPMGISEVIEAEETRQSAQIDDIVERREDETIMSQYADIDWIRGYMIYLYPGLPDDAIAEDLLEELARAMKGGKSQLSWTVSLILATKST